MMVRSAAGMGGAGGGAGAARVTGGLPAGAGTAGRQARPATQARAAAARLRAAAEEAGAWLPEAEEAGLPRPAAEAALLRADQVVAERRACPSPATLLLPGAARPRSMSACCLVANLPAAPPTKARVGQSPT